MDKHIIEQLNTLQHIEPEHGFRERTRAALLKTGERPVSFAWQHIFKIASICAVFVIVVVGVSLFNTKPEPENKSMSASLDSDNLKAEINNLTISVELKEITYRQAINQTIASALSELSNNQTKHLDPSVLKEEAETVPQFEDSKNNRMNELLNKVMF